MKIGVTSDTHDRGLPKQMLDDFQDVDLIIHAGDACSLDAINELKNIAEVIAVFGNMDDMQVREGYREKLIIKKEGASIGIFHGRGSAKKVLDFVVEEFKDEKVDVVVFGHSHCAIKEVIDGILYFNPGSPNDKFCAPYCAYGILEVKDGKVDAKIIKVK
ncbi:MAG: YfcE family phosphodiesterase [Candidatus Omnitrophica bacterium]|nr:YfcE family phosphodiesterase [Candidatus Omnitrophota bacterium]MBU1996312.1 YfcE family phosphodiesterase [Candidatus Omnitrophota bacterium]